MDVILLKHPAGAGNNEEKQHHTITSNHYAEKFQEVVHDPGFDSLPVLCSC
jgi:endonuclease IV